MRLLAIFLTALVLLIQYPLWLGKGGLLRVYAMQRQVEESHEKIALLKSRNAKLSSEVHDLKEGTGAIEERARTELGMIKEDEIFIQIIAPPDPQLPAVMSAIEKTIDGAVPQVNKQR